MTIGRELKVTALGTKVSGKTTFLLGMYAELSAGGPHGYFLNAPDPDVDLDLGSRWDRLLDDGILPERTGADVIPYHFQFLDGIRPLIDIDWFDYRGGALTDAVEGSSGDVAELHARLQDSDCVYLVVDGGYLVDPISREVVRGTLAKTGLKRMSSLLQTVIQKKVQAEEPPPTLVLLITKSDVIPQRRREDLTSLSDDLRMLIPLAFTDGITTLVCPVTVGNFGLDDPSQVSVEEIDPHGLHLPIVFSLAEYMRQLALAAAYAGTAVGGRVAELEEELRALNTGVFRNRSKIGLARTELASIEEDQATYGYVFEQAAKRAEMLFGELGGLLVFRDGEAATDV